MLLISELRMSLQTGCSFLDVIAGSASARLSSKITKGFGQLLTPSRPLKIIFLHLSRGRVRKEAKKNQHLETQVFGSLPLGEKLKNPPNLQCCLEGDDSLLRLLRTPKLKRKKKRKRFLAVTKQISPECTPLISNVSLCFLPFFCHRPERERMGKEKRDRQALDGLMSIPSPPRHLSPDPASPVRRRLFSSLPFCPLSLPQKGKNNKIK